MAESVVSNSVLNEEHTTVNTETVPTTPLTPLANSPTMPTTLSTYPLIIPATISHEPLILPTTVSDNSSVIPATSIATTPPPPPDDTNVFIHAYDCAKNNYNWHKISSSISNHPDWLTRIPQGRRWTILHQIVYFGDVAHLNEVLAYQLTNDNFRLLCKTLDDKTVREVAAERAHVHPQMLRRIERLVATDQLLHNARDNKWELVKQFLRQQPDIVNEKPPYKNLYLAHYLASTGQLDVFKNLSTVCHFKLDLIADGKTISQTARDHNHIEFAEFIENLPSTEMTMDDDDTQNEATGYDSDMNHHPTTTPGYSQGFFHDPGIMIFSINSNLSGPNAFLNQIPTTISMISIDGHQNMAHEEPFQENHKSSESHTSPISMTEEEQQLYEKTVMNNIKKFSSVDLLNAITCCITKAILKDPVVAADGFTYEREAIVNWFEKSNRSPMTNQELESKELKTNHAVKSILQSLSEVKQEEKEPHEKSKSSDDKAE